jgi:hypothetical protein
VSASGAPATAGPATQGTLTITAVYVLIGLAAIAGLLLGGSLGGGDPPPAAPSRAVSRAIAHGGLSVRVPKGWERSDAVTVLGFRRPLGLRSEDDSMRATVELLPATSSTLLPAAFMQTIRSTPERPDFVRLSSGLSAWRYRVAEDDGSITVLFAAPTTNGVATVACLSPLDGGAPRGCDAVARAITVPGSRPLEPGPGAAFHSRLPAALRGLETARTAGVHELSDATRSTDQAAAAAGLARAHKVAGTALAPLANAGDGLPSSTVRSLSTTATAYTALANAARSRSSRPYAAAGRTVASADAALRRTLKALAATASAASPTTVRPPSTPVPTPAASTPVPTPAAGTPVPTPAASKPAASTPAPTPAATTEPVTTTRPATATEPSEGDSQGFDLSLPLLALLGLGAIGLAIRKTLRETPPGPGGTQESSAS